MKLDLQKRSIPISIAAFLQRAFGSAFGNSRAPQFGVRLEERAKVYLPLLNKDEKSLGFRFTLENLRRDFDLLSEEAALGPEGLALQVKVFELAYRHEIADQLVREMFTLAPVVKLFNAIVAEASKAGAAVVQIDFNTNRPTFPVLSQKDGDWAEMMQVPTTLEEPLRGVIARVEGIGFAVLARRFWLKHLPPCGLIFSWLDGQRVEITIEEAKRG